MGVGYLLADRASRDWRLICGLYMLADNLHHPFPARGGQAHVARDRRSRRKAGKPPQASLDPVWHEAVRAPRRHGSDPQDPQAEIRPHVGPAGCPGGAPWVDRRSYRGGPGRRPMPRGRWVGTSQRRQVAVGKAHDRRVVLNARGRKRSPGRDALRRGRAIRSAGRGAARLRPARPARHRSLLCDARRHDVLRQWVAMGGLQEIRLGHRGRERLRRQLGTRACHTPTLPFHPVLRRAALRRRA